MSWLLRHNWPWSLIAFLLGAAITWILLDRRRPALEPQLAQPAERREEVLVGALVAQPAVAAQPTVAQPAAAQPTVAQPAVAQPAVDEPRPEPTRPAAPTEPQPVFSEAMDGEPTLFDVATHPAEPQVRADAPPGRYGEGSADAVPHQGPPDGFTIKGNAQSKLFHTPDSPYYGRTKPEVWFRSETDAERAGFTKYARRPRKSADPRD